MKPLIPAAPVVVVRLVAGGQAFWFPTVKEAEWYVAANGSPLTAQVFTAVPGVEEA